MEQSTKATEQPAATMEQPTTMEQPATTTEQPNTTMESPTAAMESPTEAIEQFTATEHPDTTMDQSTSTTEDLTAAMQDLTTTTSQPATTSSLTPSLPGAFPTTSTPRLLRVPLSASLNLLYGITRTFTHDATILDKHESRAAPATEASDLPPLSYYYFHEQLSNYVTGMGYTMAFEAEELREEMQWVLSVLVWWFAVVHCEEGVREKVRGVAVAECVAVIEEGEGEEMVVVKKVVAVWKVWMDRLVEGLVKLGEQEVEKKKGTGNEVFQWGVLGLMVLPSLLWGGLVRGY